jgi:hypothetical protein
MYQERDVIPRIFDVDYVIGHEIMREVIERCIVGPPVVNSYTDYKKYFPKVRIAADDEKLIQYTESDLFYIIDYVEMKQKYQEQREWKQNGQPRRPRYCYCCDCSLESKLDLQMWERKLKLELESIPLESVPNVVTQDSLEKI